MATHGPAFYCQPVRTQTGSPPYVYMSPAEMFRTEKLKALVNDRLKAAAEEIFSLFEKTIKEYEEEVFRSKQEAEQQQQQRSLAGWKGNLRKPLILTY